MNDMLSVFEETVIGRKILITVFLLSAIIGIIYQIK